jgi:hypothetical protein
VDFTYLFAFVLGLIFSVIACLVIVVALDSIPRKLRRNLIGVVACLVLAMSINWRFVGEMPLWVLAMDFAFILGNASLGALLGTALLWLRPKDRPPQS